MDETQKTIPQTEVDLTEKNDETSQVTARAFTKEEMEAERTPIDVDQYIGKESVIVGFDVESREFEKGRMSYYVKFHTDVIDRPNDKFDIRATKIVGISKNSKGEFGWYPESKMAAFLQRLGVNHYNDAVGKTVKVTAVDGRKGGRFLTF